MSTVTTRPPQPPPLSPDELEALIEEARRRQRRRHRLIAAAVVVAVLVVGVVTYLVTRTSGGTAHRTRTTRAAAPTAPRRSEIIFAADRAAVRNGEIYLVGLDGRRVNLSRSPAQDVVPAVSPDGKWVAFVSNRHGYAALYAVRPDGRSLRRLSPKLSAASADIFAQIAWSPDSRRAAVTTYGGALYVADVSGRGRLIGRGYADELAWSGDGRFLAYRNGDGRNSELRVVDAEGKTAWEKNLNPWSLAWSSGGRLAVGAGRPHTIFVYDERGRLLDSFRGSALGSPWSPSGDRLASTWRGRLELRFLGIGHPVPSARVPDGTISWLGSDQVGINTGLGWIDVDVATGRRSQAPNAQMEAISSDGSSVAYMRPSSFGIWTTPFTMRVSRADGTRARTVFRAPPCDESSSNFPFGLAQFTPDGRSLVYETTCPTPSSSVYAMAPDGTHLRRLTRTPWNQRDPSLSPDGRSIAFSEADLSPFEECKGCMGAIWVTDARGRHKHELTYTSPSMSSLDVRPSWSPDGKWIVFWRSGPFGYGLSVVPASGGPSGRAVRPLHVSGSSPAWGPERIAYIGDDSGVWTVSPDGSDRRKVAGDRAVALAWSGDGRLAYLGADYRTVHVIGKTRTSFRLPLQEPKLAPELAWSPDGTRLLFTAGVGTNPAELYSVTLKRHRVRRLTTAMGNVVGMSWR